MSPPSLTSFLILYDSEWTSLSLSVQPNDYPFSHPFFLNMYKRDSFLSLLIGMEYSIFSNEYGILNLYNNHMQLSIIPWFFLYFSLFCQYKSFDCRFGILHVIKLAFPANISQQSLTFSIEVFRSWFFYLCRNFWSMYFVLSR